MGYYVTLEASNFRIAPENLEAAYRALCDLNTNPQYTHLKSGGSWSGGKQTAKWFAWMDEDYHETCKSAKEILQMVGFDVAVNESGTLSVYNYDSKTGSESLFIDAISHLANPDWYMEWRGEDGDRYRWSATGNQTAQTVWV